LYSEEELCVDAFDFRLIKKALREDNTTIEYAFFKDEKGYPYKKKPPTIHFGNANITEYN
jgi:hypothetical protein